VLSTIKRAYCIGCYEPGGTHFENGSQVDLDRVYFVIYPHKNIEFRAPHPENRRFSGDKIIGKVVFK